MSKLIKKLAKPSTYFIISIIQIILLILIQKEITNLYYTGIQNKGFSKIIIDKISTSTYDKYKLLLKREDFNYFDSCYRYDKKKNIYLLNKYDKNRLEKITKRVLPLHYLFYDGLQNSKQKVLGVSEYQKIYNVLNSLSSKQKSYLLKKPLNLLQKTYTQQEIKELCLKDIQLEYKNLGYNINSIKENYIKLCLIKLFIYVLTIILISRFNVFIKYKIKNELKLIDIVSSTIILGISLFYLFNTNLFITLLISVFYIIIFTLIILFNYFRLKNTVLNKKMSNFEDMFNIKNIIDKVYIIIWSYLLLGLFIVNYFIYNRYSTYHIFVGVVPYKFQINLNYFYILLFSFPFFIILLLYLIDYYKEKRPIIKEKKKISKKRHKKNKK